MALSSTSYFYIYSSNGATFEFLEQSLMPYEKLNIKTRRISNHDILHNDILNISPENGLAIFLPGTSAGQNYRDALGSKGSDIIKTYVQKGGSFIGICAGGYLACDKIKYKGLTTNKELKSDLNFFKATALGQLDLLDKRFPEPKGWEQANVTTVSFNNTQGDDRQSSVLYWGGAQIIPYRNEKIDIIATYDQVANEDGSVAIAIASKPYGDGRAIFSGVHPEISGSLLEESPTAKRIDTGFNSFRKELIEKLKETEDSRLKLFQAMIAEALKTERAQKHLEAQKAPQKVPEMIM